MTLATLAYDTARRAPERVAVVDRDRSVTYAELDALVTRTAAALLDAGAAAGAVVGVHLDKSIEAIAALHAVLRIGAAYVPFDPTAPAERIDVIARDADPVVVATAGKPARLWAAREHAPPVVDLHDLPAGDDREIAPAPVTPDDLAYVLYTSGSTGTPKGVEITHGNARAFVDWAVTTFAVDEHDVLSGHAPLHFDLSIFDVYAAAGTGAALALVPKAESKFPVDLAKWIARERITVWYSVPTALTLLVTKADLASVDLSALRTVLFAGEVFPVRHLRTLVAALPNREFWNLYGPTETNVCTAYRVDEAPAEDDPPLPIGYAVAGDRIEIVGDDGRPAPPGEVGEIVVHGPTVAGGYRNAPDLTTARFGTGDDGQRWYRTGDRGFDTGDGCLRYVGRADAQVKRRGYRIELGDVEAALLRDPALAEAAVVAVPDDLVTNRLVAMVEPAPDAATDPRRVMRALSDVLPASLLPDSVVVVARLPRTSTGKLDRPLIARQAAADG